MRLLGTRGPVASGLVAITALAFTLSVATGTAAAAQFGIESAGVSLSSTQPGVPATQAGGHPDLRIDLTLNTDPESEPADPEIGLKFPVGNVRDIFVDTPPGLVGDVNAVPRCSTGELSTSYSGGGCPNASQVGLAIVRTYENLPIYTSVYNMESPGGDSVARLGFMGASQPFYVNVKVRSDEDYRLSARTEGIYSGQAIIGVTMTLWGVPAAAAHDTERLTPRETFPEFKTESPPRPPGLAPRPFITNPVSCGPARTVTFAADSYEDPDIFDTRVVPFPTITGCGRAPFSPELSVLPTDRRASAPTGLEAVLGIPQNETANGVASASLRDATIVLPPGMTLSPGAADGLAACSAAQVGYRELRPSTCPPASKIGTLEFDVPALTEPLHGAIYQRSPEPGNQFQVWLVTDEQGVFAKLPGTIRLNPSTGQITSLFLDNPEVPLRRLTLRFKEGERGVLATPAACGAFATAYSLTPSSGGAPVTGNAPMQIDQGCGKAGFAPRLAAGSTNAAAGAYSPFVLALTRSDGEPNVARLDIRQPAGLLAKLAGVPLCGDSPAASGNCPAASQVGTVTTGTGVGPAPLWIPQAGKEPTGVFLAGPYKGAPYSLVVKVPAQAGPFDLGDVVVRAAIRIDPLTAQVSVASDPLPQILEGVPLDYRLIQVYLDRRSFTLNPTSCAAKQVEASVTPDVGAAVTASDSFHASGCAELGFKPRLSTRLFGPTARRGHPRLKVVLAAKEGEANLARTALTLPRSAFLDQSHIGTVCTRVQFAADRCPSGSIYGSAKAWSPLLDQPLSGPVFLRSSNHTLPDLVVRLRSAGPVPIEITLDGRIDSVRGGIRTRFESLPDAPVSKFVLVMKGGRKGLLVNSIDLCGARDRATVKMTGQNGKTHDFRPRVKNGCAGGGKKGG